MYNKYMTKEYIQENLIRENGNLHWQIANKLPINTEEIYLIYYEIKPPICLCGNDIPFITFSKGYRKTCGSIECNKKSTLNSIKKTNLERYGVEHYWNNEQGMKTKLEKYGEACYNNREKAVQTCREGDLYAKSKQVFKDSLTEEEYKEHYKKVFKKVHQTKELIYGDKYYCNREKQTKNSRKTLEEKGKWVPLDQLDDWKYYKLIVRRETEKTYKEYTNEINPNEYNRVLCGEDGHQLDHIISVQEGFSSNTPIHIIANKENLQMLTWESNRAKW